METKKGKLEDILKELKKVGGIIGSSIVSRDGLAIAHDLSEGIDADTFAAMSAAMQGAAETATTELKQGNLDKIIVEAEKGRIITVSAGDKAILVVLFEPETNLGLALLEIKKVSRKITTILEK